MLFHEEIETSTVCYDFGYAYCNKTTLLSIIAIQFHYTVLTCLKECNISWLHQLSFPYVFIGEERSLRGEIKSEGMYLLKFILQMDVITQNIFLAVDNINIKAV